MQIDDAIRPPPPAGRPHHFLPVSFWSPYCENEQSTHRPRGDSWHKRFARRWWPNTHPHCWLLRSPQQIWIDNWWGFRSYLFVFAPLQNRVDRQRYSFFVETPERPRWNFRGAAHGFHGFDGHSPIHFVPPHKPPSSFRYDIPSTPYSFWFQSILAVSHTSNFEGGRVLEWDSSTAVRS